MMPFPIAHPLDAALEDFNRVTWPDADDPRLFADLQHFRPDPELLLVGRHPFAIYERAWLLAGMQPLLTAMADRPERVARLFARIGEFEERIARHYVQIGVEAAWICDDYGMNSAMMFSPEMWKRFVRPHLERIVKRYHDAGVLVILHSCGNITPLVNELVEVGIDVLDPLQPNCNRLDHVRRRTAGRVCLCGGVEASTLLAGDVMNTNLRTHERISQLGKDGGYIVGPDDEWEYPPDTHQAMLKAVEIHRRRPR
jgi:uroporphyrinogen decarboxylase